jgi:uncharacterized protein YbcV (DUF1398 family)
MFTTEQIQPAHAKVRSGADFPAYIREIKDFGVTHYEAYVTDGHIDYHGPNDYTVQIPAKYPNLHIADMTNVQLFKAELLAHQQGKTDYLTFIKSCAANGIKEWSVCMAQMTCTYKDKDGNEILVEKIPY